MHAPWPDPRQVEQDLIISRALCDLEESVITRAHAEQRMLEKLTRSLTEDIRPLLPVGAHFNDDDAMQAFERVWRALIARIDGDPWKLTEAALADLRAAKYPALLTN